ncbi:Nn.00g025950.m01.CDS01 [Neocucurbitaria sp. VM-36]
MATHASDNLDEFFDFARLEHDHSLRPSSASCHHQSEPISLPDDVMVMDWATEDMTTICPADAFLPHDVHMQISYEETPTGQSVQQSPLVDTPYQLPSTGDDSVAPSAIPTWHMCSAAAVQDPSRCHEPHAFPPSSSYPVREHLDLTRESDEEGLRGTLCPPQEPTTTQLDQYTPESKSPLVLEIPVNHSQNRPTAPLRQASTASWKPASAKRKGPQSRIPLEARQILEDEFVANPYPCSWEMDIIAHQANLDVKKVRNWFNNTRARKKGGDPQVAIQGMNDDNTHSLKPKLSRDSLDAFDKNADEFAQPPQPPLAVYLAQSYQEEAVEFSAVQAAIDSGSLSGSGDFQDDGWSGSWEGRRGSVITSIASSEGTAPTTYTVSSSGSRSNISSFGRDRRRGRRRMAWKESPYTRQKFNGLNSAGEPQQDLPFFCTFCPRAFKTKYEWIRHEDSVHALRTTWICCDTKSVPLQSCPFCGQAHPDDAHMATHKYQQCRNKPESQRTFYRRDHFVQHLHHVHFANAKHPSLRVGCQARLMAEEGQNFGCKDLAMKWRRFGAPMKRDDPMLHCGFCGKKSKDWSDRCEHVAEHLIARELDRAVWWAERKENHLENLYSASPFESFRCRYCLKVFTDVQSMNEHSHCRVWSCRFLKCFDDVAADNAGPPLCPDFPSAKAHHCHLCGAGYRTFHVEHAQTYHRYRSCNQEFYTSEEAFLQHLHNFHGASAPALLQGSSFIEQSFMRNKGASFEPVEFNESWQPCLMELDVNPVGPFMVEKPGPALSLEKRDQTYAKKQSPTRKKIREESQNAPSGPAKAQRQRADTTTSKTETYGPRFFRLSTYVPFLSSRIFYSHNAKPSGLPKDNHAVVEEMPKPHVASLVMCAGLVSMAGVRWAIKPEKDLASGMVELTLDDEAD